MDTYQQRFPDDWHVHLRDATPENDRLLPLTTLFAAQYSKRVVAMPNVKPPIRTGEEAEAYQLRILEEAKRLGYPSFEPIVPLKLTDATTEDDIVMAAYLQVPVAKVYPVGTTTNSEVGVSDLLAMDSVLSTMQEVGMVLSVHPQMPGTCCWTAEQEYVRMLQKVAKQYPQLRIVAEHISTAESVRLVESMPRTVGATITATHLYLTIDDLVGYGCQPHNVCNPIAKLPSDREALRRAAMSGDPRFFFGSDSAPHVVNRKVCSNGERGVFSAPIAMPLLIQIFEECGELKKLEAFTSKFGARFYGLPLNEEKITFVRRSWNVVSEYLGEWGAVVPFLAGKKMEWQLQTSAA